MSRKIWPWYLAIYLAAVGVLTFVVTMSVVEARVASPLSPEVEPLPQPTLAVPQASDRETIWSAWLAQELRGEAEAVLPDGSRVDILNSVYATEVEWISKWEQAVGQSLYYACVSGRAPRIVLLRKHEPLEVNDFLRCRLVCEKYKIELRVVDVRNGTFEL
jgi:hypothetical protein